jgi:hypothetical protein
MTKTSRPPFTQTMPPEPSQSAPSHHSLPQYLAPTALAITLLLPIPPAQGETTPTQIPKLGNIHSFVDIDNDGDKDILIKTNNGTIGYYENVGNTNVPLSDERTGAAKPLNEVDLGPVSGPTRTRKESSDKEEPLKILSYSKEPLYLSPEQTTAEFFLTVNEPWRVEESAIVIGLPRTDKSIPPDESEIIMDLDLSCVFKGTAKDVFKYPGFNEVRYYVKEKGASDYLDRERSVVYKGKVGNQAPAAFNLFSPPDNANTSLAFKFEWELTTDPEDDKFNYALLIAEDPEFNNVVYHRLETYDPKRYIDEETVLKDGSKGLKDQTTYYWKVEVVDDHGDTTQSRQIYSFRTDKGNPHYNPEDNDYEDDGILGDPVLPDPLIVNALEWGRYLVRLTETGNQIFTVTSLVPTTQVEKYEAYFNPMTNKLSIPAYGAMELIPNTNPLQLKRIF